MRFILAIGVFIVAAVLLGTGIIQKAFFGGPEFVSVSAELNTSSTYAVISGKSLRAYDGIPNVIVSGAKTNFVGYGRTEDVMAWIGQDRYDVISLTNENSELSIKNGQLQAQTDVAAVPEDLQEQTIVNPAGSDLWLGEDFGERSALLPANASSSMSAIIASDGVEAAPGDITLQWPLPSRIPYANAFILVGGVLALVGLLLYLWALRHLRNQNGPRRGGGAPKPKSISMPKPKSLTSAAPKGRRALGRGSSFIALGVIGSLTLGLAGCTPLRPTTEEPTPTPTSTDIATLEGPAPAVTELQLDRILAKVSATITQADTELNSDLAGTRLIGPALEMRNANYAIRRADGAQPALPALAPGPVTFLMPQATDSWPRIVFTVVQDETDPTIPTTGMVLVQNSPRENYHVEYIVTLEPNASVPTVASPEVGSALVKSDSKLLLIAPDQLAEAYGSVLISGTESPYYGLFDFETDTLVTQVGKDYKDQKRSSVSERASLDFTQTPGSGEPLALATLDSGAIVTVSLNEIETVKPTQAGASVSPEGQAKILSGITSSTTGVESVYGIELAFYVPPLGSTEKIRLLGYTQGLISARGL